MAMRFQRVSFVVIAVAAVLLPLRRQNNPLPSPENARQERSGALAQKLSAAGYRWSALEQRDSAMALISRWTGRDTVPRIVLSDFPAGGRPADAEQALLDRIWQGIGPVDSTVSVAVLAYDPARYETRSPLYLFSGNLITQREGRTSCIAVLPAYPGRGGRIQVGRERLSWGLTPCALLAAFGKPGKSVRQWLDDTRYAPARWLGWSKVLPPDEYPAPWAYLPDPSFSTTRVRPRSSLLNALGLDQIAEFRAPPYSFGAPGLRCIAGDLQSCEESVLDPVTRMAERDIPEDLSGRIYHLRIPGITPAAARPPGPSFLSDLVDDKGRDRFKAFWRSNRSVDQAFADAFGERLGEWTSRWAVGKWQRMWEARYQEVEFLFGVTLKQAWSLSVLGWTGGLLFIAGWVARRRQVT